jgi:alpha-glucosidase (family GH31 glycosyl hydrolase)
MKTTIYGLSHCPLGIEHPYHQEPDERFPRWPLAGQPVELGVRTFPPNAAARVWATWSVGPGEDGSAEAVLTAKGGTTAETIQFATSTIRLGGTQPGDTWRAGLPAFARGQQVEYCVHAAQATDIADASNQNQVDSPVYSFTVLDWLSAGLAVGYRLTSNGVEISFTSTESGVETTLAVRLIGADQLSFTLSAAVLVVPVTKQTSAPHQVSLGGKSATAAGASIATEPALPAWQALEQSQSRLEMVAGPLRLDLSTQPFQLQISRAGKPLLATSTLPEWLVGRPGEPPSAVRLAFDSPPEEGFYGLGERFHAFNLRGSAPDVTVFEQYKNQGIHTYIPVSFFLSSQGYGFYLETARFSSFDLAAAHPNRWSLKAELGPQASIGYFLYAAAGPLENLRLFSHQVGLPKLPPDWAFGPWISSNEWNSQAIVMEQVHLAQLHDIPVTVLVIEAWADEKTSYIWNDSQYTPKPADQPFTLGDFTFSADGKWPNPKAMIDELHRQGIRLVLWQIPVLKSLGGERHAQQEIDEAYMLEKDYCLRWPDGSPYRVRPFWFHDSLLLDFNNPSAVEWWMSKRAYLLDELSVDGFKTDGGEHLWGKDVVFANGLRGDEGLNLYPNLYVGAYHRFVSRKRNGDALTFSRAGFTGAQSFPCHWAGDENSTWEAFRASLNAGLSAGLSGIPFWGWDIAGFSGEIPSAELYLRATAMATFCPIMQYHSEFNDHRRPLRDRTPWNIAERTGCTEVIDICRQYTHLRMRLLPYITAEACHCAETGEPLMRPLFLDWPDDSQALQVVDQYCFGRSLLVSPVLQPGATDRRLYLPAGQWLDFWTGTEYTGRQWFTIPAPLERIPVFRRLDQAWTPLL